jgi:hypothetical protein
MGADLDAIDDLARLVAFGTTRIGIGCAQRITRGRSAA